MLLLASEGLGFSALRNDPTWGRVAGWFDHVPWDGLVFWDLIQPAFMFMVGVACLRAGGPNGAWRDRARQLPPRRRAIHPLTILSQILICVGSGQIKLQMIIVLSQVAFMHPLSYLVMQWRWRWQVVTAVGLLVFWMVLLFAFPGPDGPYSRRATSGWSWTGNLHYDYDPAYSTLNFIAIDGLELTGVWTGQLLMGSKTTAEKLGRLTAGMLFSFAAGLVLGL